MILNKNLITIDGPSGSGKGTVSAMLANKLNWHYLDSGGLYRVLALYALETQIDISSQKLLSDAAINLPVKFVNGQVFLLEIDVTNKIKTEQCGNLASKIALLPEVRQALLQLQRNYYRAPGLVADGRDMGTVVFPEAILKIYLDASIQERAKRRCQELLQRGLNVNLVKLEDEIAQRDMRDSTRAIAPLRPALDAVILDATNLSPVQVLDYVMQLYQFKVESIN